MALSVTNLRESSHYLISVTLENGIQSIPESWGYGRSRREGALIDFSLGHTGVMEDLFHIDDIFVEAVYAKTLEAATE